VATILRVTFNVLVLLILAGAASYAIDRTVENHEE
jgi:hypothetical protein